MANKFTLSCVRWNNFRTNDVLIQFVCCEHVWIVNDALNWAQASERSKRRATNGAKRKEHKNGAAEFEEETEQKIELLKFRLSALLIDLYRSALNSIIVMYFLWLYFRITIAEYDNRKPEKKMKIYLINKFKLTIIIIEIFSVLRVQWLWTRKSGVEASP